ncbi:MAG TPA: flagellar hook-associated protein FlgK [Burkholderiales bacterium]|nr:flagellar hook-associated protein FlgK [Burkholderiales bacterium]
MSSGIFGIGVGGLEAAQAGLLTTSHNISNVNTPGYSRQTVVQATNEPQFTGSGFFGTGVRIDTVRRNYSDFTAAQVRQAQTQASQFDTYSSQISQIDNLLADPDGGLSPALDDFFSSVNAVAAHPDDIPSRQAMLSSAQTLVARFHQLNGQVQEWRDGANAQIKNTVDSINSYSQQLAQLNLQIATASGAAGGQPPNDLLDQRDALIDDLTKQVGASVVKQSDGSLNVFLANGQALVVGSAAFQLTTVPDADDPRNLQVALQTGGSVVRFKDSALTGGALGGLLAFRGEALGKTESSLDQIALSLAQGFNAQHRLGQDLNGNPGGDFFSLPQPAVTVAAGNGGNATITASITDVTALAASDYRLQFDGTNYTLTRLADNTVQTFTSLPQTVDGIAFAQPAGTPQAGDSFLISRGGAGDIGVALGNPAAIAAAVPISTQAGSQNVGSGTISAGSVDGPSPIDPALLPVTVKFTDPGTYEIDSNTGVPVSTGNAYTPGAPISYNGWTVKISGAPAAGDTFKVESNTGGTGDNRNALLLAGLQTQKLMAGGTATLQDSYSQLVGVVGSLAHGAQASSDAQNALLSQAQQRQQSVSGVNLDEEAANLQRYQQAYQASGKLIATAATLFDTILDILN